MAYRPTDRPTAAWVLRLNGLGRCGVREVGRNGTQKRARRRRRGETGLKQEEQSRTYKKENIKLYLRENGMEEEEEVEEQN